MTLAGFKSSNHPQQTAKRGAKDDVDDRGTDRAFFDATAERFGGFTLDVAAAPHNAKCAEYFTRDDDGLSRDWLTPSGDPGRVWCNPPYSDIRAWVEKAHEQWTDGCVDLIVMLLPANRVEQRWWQDLVEPYRDGRNGHRFLSSSSRAGCASTAPAGRPAPRVTGPRSVAAS
jgi:phage N-6-adenine-methyltransferase